MALKSVKEYAAAIRERYWKGNKEKKVKILDEVVKILPDIALEALY